MNVTLVTRDATLDDLSDGDYREIYVELRRLDMPPEYRISYDKFMAGINSHYSKALWAKYDAGEVRLNRAQRNELRAAMNLPLLPPTVAEATAQASPDAAVWTVGDGVPEHVIMVGATPVTLHVNGTVQTVSQTSNVTGVTRHLQPRKRYFRPCMPEEHEERLKRLKTVSAADVFERGLQTYENA